MAPTTQVHPETNSTYPVSGNPANAVASCSVTSGVQPSRMIPGQAPSLRPM